MTLLNPKELLSSANGRSRIFLGRQCKINDNLKDTFLTFKWLASVKHAIIMSILNINFNPLKNMLKCVLWFQFPFFYIWSSQLRFPGERLIPTTCWVLFFLNQGQNPHPSEITKGLTSARPESLKQCVCCCAFVLLCFQPWVVGPEVSPHA